MSFQLEYPRLFLISLKLSRHFPVCPHFCWSRTEFLSPHQHTVCSMGR